MTWPTLTVRIATSASTDAFTLDDDPRGELANLSTDDLYGLGDTFGRTWSDITTSVRSDAGIRINRGSTRQQGPFFVFESGQLQFELDDRSGDFDPLNLDGPYVSAGVSQLIPGLPVTVSATHAGTTWVLFTGYVDSWNKTYPGEGNTDSVVQVMASDPAAYLQKALPNQVAAVGSGEYVHQRLDRLMDAVSWPTDQRNLDDRGTVQLLPTEQTDEVWTEMQSAATSVNGYLFVSVDGIVVYRDRSSFPVTNDVTLGEGMDLPVVDLELANDWDQIYNVVRLQRPEGAVQQLRDETSVARFGTRAFTRNDMWQNSDGAVADSAEIVLTQSKDQRLRLDGAVVEPDDTYSNDQWAAMLGLELLTRIGSTIETTDGRTVSNDGLVRGVQLSVAPYRWSWRVSTIAAPDRGGNFTLDDLGVGLLADWTPEQRRIIAEYYIWMSGYSPFPGTTFSEGLDAMIYAFSWTMRPFSEYIFRFVDSSQDKNGPVSGYEDWIGLTYAQWTATETTYPALALF